MNRNTGLSEHLLSR